MMRLYWFNLVPNFGDELSPRLCAHLSGQQVEHCGDFCRCDLVAIGSVLHLVNSRQFRGAIWGAGLIEPPAKPMRFPDAAIHAVRGKLTRDFLGCGPEVAMGDPGLLVDLLVGPVRKRFEVGLIPHFVDQGHPAIRRIAERSPHITVIDVKAGVDQVLAQIGECRVILSSAMHGLIAADALGIPNAWICLSDRVLGGDFKFRDYYSVFGIDRPEPVPFGEDESLETLREKVKDYRRDGLAAIQKSLRDSFPFPAGRAWLRLARRRLRALLPQRS